MLSLKASRSAIPRVRLSLSKLLHSKNLRQEKKRIGTNKSIVDDGYKRRESVWQSFINRFVEPKMPGTLILVRHGTLRSLTIILISILIVTI